jgi:beta-N-acetylhexosaminidase
LIQPLTPRQAEWVDKTLGRLSLAQCAAQMLNISQFTDSNEYWRSLIERVPIGSMRGSAESAQGYRDLLAEMHNISPIPLLTPANMEHGAAELRGYGTEFPWLMAAGAANDEALIAAMGQAIATEARHIGVNWIFGPVVDLNYHFDNSITNIRSLGDDPERVSRLATAMIRSLQEHGLAATAKHFPGDGIDDRDQHLLTTINSLPFEQWLETYGRVWRAVIDAGVMCIMPGHISLPDYQGYREQPEAAPPATLSRQLLVDLLRQELGFEGLIVSDNASMIGFTIHARAEDRVVECIAAGADVYLNADPEHDFDRLMRGVHDGRISEERIYEAARRVLEMKARLNLFESPFGPAPTSEQSADFQRAAQALADKSITLLRHNGQQLNLASQAKVLTVTYAKLNERMGMHDLNTFDEELRARGYQVQHLLNPGSEELRSAAGEIDAVFINLYMTPLMSLGSIRMTDHFRTWAWRSLFVDHPNVVYTAFGNPYVLYEAPHLPRLIATYGGSDVSQRAAVKVWLGEMEAEGTLPVRMPQVKIKPLPV